MLEKASNYHWKDALREVCCDLMVIGHRDVFKYGYSFFKTACKRARGLEKRQILNATTSIQLAFAGKRDFQKFLKEFR